MRPKAVPAASGATLQPQPRPAAHHGDCAKAVNIDGAKKHAATALYDVIDGRQKTL